MKTFLRSNWPWLVQLIYLPVLLYAASAYAEALVSKELAKRDYISRFEFAARLDTINGRLDNIQESLRRLIELHIKP